MKIRYKIMTSLLTIILISSLILTAIWYNYSVDMVDTYLQDMSNSIMSDAYDSFNYVFTDTSYMLSVIALNKSSIVEPLEEINKIKLNSENQFDSDYLENKRTIDSFLSSLNGYKYFIVGFEVVSKNGYGFKTSTLVQNSDDLFDEISAFDNLKNTQIIMMPPVETTSTWFNMKSNFVVPAARAVINDNKEIIGYVILYFDYSVIEEMFSNNLPKGSMFQVVDMNGNLIYTNNENEELITADSAKDFAYTNYFDDNVNWDFTIAIPTDEITAKSTNTLKLTLVYICVTLVAAIIVSIIVTSRITNNITILSNKMKKISKGNLQVTKSIKSNDEINSMENVFNDMIDEINLLMQNIADKEKSKRKIEMAFLQTQINPHFISNTLNNVVWMAKARKADNIVNLTSALNNVLRGILKKSDECTTLGEELDYVSNFLRILEHTGQYDFETSIDVDKEIINCSVLRFILQPIVENSIYHGMADSLNKNYNLTINAKREDDNLLITVYDNGKGMTAEKIEQICKCDKKQGKLSSIGIQNVIERIKLYYGDSYGLTYESEEGLYTRVNIKLPYQSTAEAHNL